jgi:hypothetical protein
MYRDDTKLFRSFCISFLFQEAEASLKLTVDRIVKINSHPFTKKKIVIVFTTQIIVSSPQLTPYLFQINFNIITCVRVTRMTGYSSDDWIY